VPLDHDQPRLQRVRVKHGARFLSHTTTNHAGGVEHRPGPSRILLAKSLQAKSKVVRYLAAKQMRVLLRARVSDFHDWGVKLLIKQVCTLEPTIDRRSPHQNALLAAI